MRKTRLRLVSNIFVKYLMGVLPPSGRPSIYHWQAECNVILDSLDPSAIPDVGEGEELTEDVYKKSMEWLLTQIQTTYAGHWAIACLCQLVRVYVDEHARDIIATIKDEIERREGNT